MKYYRYLKSCCLKHIAVLTVSSWHCVTWCLTVIIPHRVPQAQQLLAPWSSTNTANLAGIYHRQKPVFPPTNQKPSYFLFTIVSPCTTTAPPNSWNYNYSLYLTFHVSTSQSTTGIIHVFPFSCFRSTSTPTTGTISPGLATLLYLPLQNCNSNQVRHLVYSLKNTKQKYAICYLTFTFFNLGNHVFIPFEEIWS